MFDKDWKFLREDMAPYTPDDRWGGAKAGAYDFGAVKDRLDDSGWMDIELPHDYVREGEFTQKITQADNLTDIPAMQSIQSRLHAGGSLEPKPAWYRKHFTLPENIRDKHIYIKFDGVYRDCDVYVNQMFVGSYRSGYTYFVFDLTDFLHKDGENIISVRVNPTGREGWWYEGGGIYRHAWLLAYEDLLIEPYRLGVSADVDLESKRARIDITAEITSRAYESKEGELKAILCDAEGRVICSRTSVFSVDSWGKCTVKQQMEISGEDFHLWDVGDPYLYTIKAFLTDKKTGICAEESVENIGLKKAQFTADDGFYLNGRKLLIQGFCAHHDHAGCGIGMPDGVVEYRLRKMQEMGMNAYRSAHHQPSDVLLDLCDRLGILVFSETRRMSSAEEDLEQLRKLILQGRNHASVFLWGIGNEEINVQHKPETILTTERMKREIAKLDPVRPVTAAVVCWDGKEHFPDAHKYFDVTKHLDIMGFNYCMTAWEDYHEHIPDQPVIITEIDAANSSTRGIYATNEKEGHFFTLDPDNRTKCTNGDRAAGRKEIGEREWKYTAEHPWLAGAFLWTGIDYRGEPTPMPWPAVSSFFGVLDHCGFAKDSFYYYKSWWTKAPMIHLFPHWNHAGKEGQRITVYAYSNLDRVELFVNGKSYGAKEPENCWYLSWEDVVYEPGELKAVGYRGEERYEEIVRTTKAVHHVEIEKYGENCFTEDPISIFNVKLVDENGDIVPDACDEITFELGENTQLIGTGNGDQASHESDLSLRRHAFNGLAQIIVRSEGEPLVTVRLA